MCRINETFPNTDLSPDRQICPDCLFQLPRGRKLALIMEVGTEGLGNKVVRGSIAGVVDVLGYWNGRIRPRPALLVRGHGRAMAVFAEEIVDVVEPSEGLGDDIYEFGSLAPGDHIDGEGYRRLYPHRKPASPISHYEVVAGLGLLQRCMTREQGITEWHTALDQVPNAELVRVLESGSREVVLRWTEG
jgi:hypothetical protein